MENPGNFKIHTCQCCNFSTPLKGNYTRHMNTEVHKLNAEIKILKDEIQRLKAQFCLGSNEETDENELLKSSNTKKRNYDIQPIELVEEVIKSSNTNSNEEVIISTNTILNKVEPLRRSRKCNIQKVELIEDIPETKTPTASGIATKPIPEIIPEQSFMDKFYKVFNNPKYNKFLKKYNFTDEYDDDETLIILKYVSPSHYLEKDFYKTIILEILEVMNYEVETIKCTNYKNQKFIVDGEKCDKYEMKILIEKMIDGVSALISRALSNTIKLPHIDFNKLYGINLNDFNSSSGYRQEIINTILCDDEKKETLITHIGVGIAKYFSKNKNDLDDEDEKKKKKPKPKANKKKSYNEDGDTEDDSDF